MDLLIKFENICLEGVPSKYLYNKFNQAAGNKIITGSIFSPRSSAALVMNTFGWFAAQAMKEVFEPYNVVTEGIIKGMTREGIDHIAISNKISSRYVWGWPNIVYGKRLSDHDGAGCDLILN